MRSTESARMQSTESARMQSTEMRECRVESTESARVQSQEEGTECMMRAQRESTVRIFAVATIFLTCITSLPKRFHW